MSFKIAILILTLWSQDGSPNRKLALLMERVDRIVEDASQELWRAGALSDQTVRSGDAVFNQFAYAFKIACEQYQHGKNDWSDDLERAKAFLEEIAQAREVEGGWLAKAAQRRLLPKIRSSLQGVALAAPWESCDGNENGCLTCEIKRKSK